MTTMGRHSPPVDGEIVANGHQLVPLAPAALQKAGPVPALPQQDDPGQPRTAPDRPGRLTLAVSAFRRNWWRLVFATVGAVAAVVSYGHIVNLFLTWHAPLYDARLMPIAIDGLIIIGAGAAKGGQKRLGWSAIGPGLAASLYANVMNGLPYGYGAAMGSGWATVALFLATNVMERWKAAPVDATDVQPAAAVVTPRHDSGHDSRDDRPPRKAAPRKPAPAMTKQARAAVILRDNPGLKNRELEALTDGDIDVRTFQRARNGTAKTP
jgi:hypothetical protein